MYGENSLINYKTKFDQYPMLILEELFDVLEFSWIFNTLDLRPSYYQLPVLVED